MTDNTRLVEWVPYTDASLYALFCCSSSMAIFCRRREALSRSAVEVVRELGCESGRLDWKACTTRI